MKKITIGILLSILSGMWLYPAMLFSQTQTINVSGTVVDAETGEPLIGAVVRLKGDDSKYSITDVDGKFSFIGILPDAELEVSYVSYKNQSVSVDGMTELAVKMLPDSEQLEDAVVIGYGTMDKKELTSAISHIN